MKRDEAILKAIYREMLSLPSFMKGYTKDRFLKSEKTQKAVCMTLLNIGELVKGLSSEIKKNYNMVQWKEIEGMRMLRYRSDIWEATLSENKGTPHIRQIVIFFYRKDDNKNHQLSDHCGKTTTLKYTYQVIRVWEEPRQQVIDKELVGLYPLLPLMKGETENENPEEVLQQSIAVIQQVEDESLQQDLLAVMAILTERKYTADLVLLMIRREMIMESLVYQEWMKEARTEAKTEGIGLGKAEKAHDAICKILKKRLGVKSFALQQQVRTITSEPILDWIFEEIMDVAELETAQRIINEAVEQIEQLDRK